MTAPDAPDAPRDLLDEVEQALQQATPGRWQAIERFDSNDGYRVCAVEDGSCICCVALMGNVDEGGKWDAESLRRFSGDQNLIAKSPEWLGALAQRVRTAEAETARLREALYEIKYYALDWSDRYASQEVWWDVVKKIQRMATVGASRPEEGQ